MEYRVEYLLQVKKKVTLYRYHTGRRRHTAAFFNSFKRLVHASSVLAIIILNINISYAYVLHTFMMLFIIKRFFNFYLIF